LESLARLSREDIGLPEQIAHYSCFPVPGEKRYKFEYQSASALKSYSALGPDPRCIAGLIEEKKWKIDARKIDRLGLPGLVPIVESYRIAGHAEELFAAHVITNRGTLVDLAIGKEGEYHVIFISGLLVILRNTFEPTIKKKEQPQAPFGVLW